VKLVSLGQGEIDRKLSWSDFKALQDRIDMLEKSQSSRGGDGEEAPLFRNFFGNNGIETNDEKDDETETKSVDDDGTYELPESTYTLMITENICSLSFLAAIVACAIAIFSLVIVLINELDNGDEDNPLGLPAGVTREVRMAQFLGVIIGVLMEEEIPLGLEILAHALVAQRTANSRKYSFNRIVLSSILRLCVGYLFLLSLFLTVIQESDVLDIFFDVLALEFVETIDDVIFGLSKRGFFGRGLKIATHRTHFLVKASTSEATTKMKERLMLWANRFIRLVYLFNGGLMIAGLVVLAIKQQNGDFRCHSVSNSVTTCGRSPSSYSTMEHMKNVCFSTLIFQASTLKMEPTMAARSIQSKTKKEVILSLILFPPKLCTAKMTRHGFSDMSAYGHRQTRRMRTNVIGF